MRFTRSRSRLRVARLAAPRPIENESKNRSRWICLRPRSITSLPTSQPTVAPLRRSPRRCARARRRRDRGRTIFLIVRRVGSMPIATASACCEPSTPLATSANAVAAHVHDDAGAVVVDHLADADRSAKPSGSLATKRCATPSRSSSARAIRIQSAAFPECAVGFATRTAGWPCNQRVTPGSDMRRAG